MSKKQFDFSGWATKAGLLCGDGRTILPGAFAHQNGEQVPLVWNHNHDDPSRVLGHAILEARGGDMYANCVFNDTEMGSIAKQLVKNGDVNALSICANKLQQKGGMVKHGQIRELSLVLAGANPGAHISYVDMAHSESGNENEEAVISFVGPFNELKHSDDADYSDDDYDENEDDEDYNEGEEDMGEEIMHADGGKKTIKEIFDTLTDEQKNAVYAIVGMTLGDEDDENGGNEDMKHNVFDSDTQNDNSLMHAAEGAIIGDAKKYGSMKESYLAHAEEYGIDGIEWLFPEVHNMNPTPEFIKRETGWVDKVFGGAHKVPWSRIKSVFADITEDEARAKGYIKGKLKKEEVFSLLKRTTQPTTIYKKQKMDRDDIIDLGSFDAVSWLKTEMRMMLNEEIARAILIGDGRLASSDDKINEDCIRPIYKDVDLFSVKCPIAVTAADDASAKTKKIINGIIRSRKQYKGSGNPTFFTTEDFITECLLLEDGIGHKLYKSVDELRVALRVSSIETVEVMEGMSREVGEKTRDLVGIIVNMNDYNVGADKGGAVNMFDDFDIDYNQQKYLIETRCSGSLVKPFSALVIETEESAS